MECKKVLVHSTKIHGGIIISNLLTSGVSFSLLSANSSAKMAEAPINMASREQKKSAPDQELIERCMSYGVEHLGKAENSKELAAAELEEAKEIAKAEQEEKDEARDTKRAEKKVEDEARLEEVRQENKEQNDAAFETASKNPITNGNVSSSNSEKPVDGETISPDGTAAQTTKSDTIEISVEALKLLANSEITKTDVPKLTSSNTDVKISKSKPKLNVTV